MEKKFFLWGIWGSQNPFMPGRWFLYLSFERVHYQIMNGLLFKMPEWFVWKGDTSVSGGKSLVSWREMRKWELFDRFANRERKICFFVGFSCWLVDSVVFSRICKREIRIDESEFIGDFVGICRQNEIIGPSDFLFSQRIDMRKDIGGTIIPERVIEFWFFLELVGSDDHRAE